MESRKVLGLLLANIPLAAPVPARGMLLQYCRENLMNWAEVVKTAIESGDSDMLGGALAKAGYWWMR